MKTTKSPLPPQHDFGVLLNLAFGAFKAELHDALRLAGFDDLGSSFGYVFRLLADGPLNLSEVADALGMTAPGALKIVNDMTAKGYVERLEHAGDARQKPLSLTPRARNAMAAAHAFHLEFEAALARRVGVPQTQAARRLLEAIVESAETNPGRERPRLRPL
jgi:DNA-binding MarR family transcriptional regulator